MAASLASKLSRGTKSLLGGLTKSLLGGLTNHCYSGILRSTFEMTNSRPFVQKRTFIQMGTKLTVVDNSGAKVIQCIQALKADKRGARLGDIIVASVKEVRPGGKVEKSKVVRAVVVRAAMPRGRCDGSEVRFDDNAAVILDDKNDGPKGTRVFGPVPHELRKKKHLKILTLAQHLA